ncbi:cysteine-rich with EGF-like domain protein 2 isoform X2 [Littorina saxatilis]|uniref:cysteine-rich with EGF-like domain protein 2 isoform X2 n=2 Tax=Littorina saxatilis TaxID=31220 RepID=UPI0038B50B96
MKLISLALTFVTFLLIVSVIHAKKKKEKGPQCSTCKEIVRNFAKGLERTKKSNYGGGNTDWEESRLGQYANSEVRLTEIMDDLCSDAGKECPQMLEAHEELVEEFWFNSGLAKVEVEFHRYFCIENVKACCPNNTFGPSCKACTGGAERPCKENGECDGQGTREGSGKCKCKLGYSGKECDSCNDGYYEDHKNDTHTVCKVCHISCKTSCSGDGPNTCDECKEGWKNDENTGCQDINECSDDPCKENEYCSNTQGSYSCLRCNVACNGCAGPGADKCAECNDGYLQKDMECLDIDECTSDGHEGRCTLEGQKCINTAGSFKCICQAGFVKDGDGCKLKPKDKSKSEGKKGKDEWQLSRRETDLLISMMAFTGITVIFLVISKLCYLINPFLLSVPVAGYSALVYYLINQYE